MKITRNKKIIKFNDIAYTHYEWLKKMNWNNPNNLEALGLLSSEIGEAAAESLNTMCRIEFSQELIDILLRTLGILKRYDVDIDQRIAEQNTKVFCDFESINWKERSNLESLSIIMIEVSKAINCCRKEDKENKFLFYLVNIMIMTIDLAERNSVDIKDVIEYKMNRNFLNGNRGREK